MTENSTARSTLTKVPEITIVFCRCSCARAGTTPPTTGSWSRWSRTFGTMTADAVHDGVGIGYDVTTPLFGLFTACVFAASEVVLC